MTQKHNETHRLLRVRQIVKPDGILPICRSTFLSWVHAGKIPPGIKIGRVRFWKLSSIHDLISRFEAEEDRNG